MSMQKGWQFPPNNGGRTDGFNDSAIDTFAGHRLSAVVREIIQNSLDAKADSAKPVVVEFSLKHIPKEKFDDLNGLARHLTKCLEVAEESDYEKAREFHSDAVHRINKKGDVPVLCIHDSNTLGLTGPLEGASGAWVALTKGTGMTQKISGSSLGSYGHGSKAPFSLGHLRSLYYLSKTRNPSEQDELRFQGKSILQSHHHPETGELTQGTGFFGFKDGLKPLIDDDIPEWAQEVRNEHSNGYGTSVLIPHPMFDEGLFPETKITVIANFFYAIRLGLLSVIVNGDLIDKDNVEEVYRWCVANLEHENDEIDKNHIEHCFKSIDCIIDCTHQGHAEITGGFGRIDWFIKIDDTISTRRVAVARESGMLITRKPHNLQAFQGLKPFEMFVFVNEGDGSKALKEIENPAHDNFEFDRIKGTKNEKSTKVKYNRFAKKIREILKNYASVEIDGEEQLSELSSFIFDLGSSSDSSENTERGKDMYISTGAPPKIRLGTKGNSSAGGTTTTAGTHFGKNKGKGGKGSKQGDQPGTGIKNVPAIGGDQGVLEDVSKTQVDNLRVIHRKRNNGMVDVSFNIYKTGLFSFQLIKTGESESEVIPLIYDQKKVDSYRLPVNEPGRISITLQLSNPNDLKLAMEGYVDEVSQ